MMHQGHGQGHSGEPLARHQADGPVPQRVCQRPPMTDSRGRGLAVPDEPPNRGPEPRRAVLGRPRVQRGASEKIHSEVTQPPCQPRAPEESMYSVRHVVPFWFAMSFLALSGCGPDCSDDDATDTDCNTVLDDDISPQGITMLALAGGTVGFLLALWGTRVLL